MYRCNQVDFQKLLRCWWGPLLCALLLTGHRVPQQSTSQQLTGPTLLEAYVNCLSLSAAKVNQGVPGKEGGEYGEAPGRDPGPGPRREEDVPRSSMGDSGVSAMGAVWA